MLRVARVHLDRSGYLVLNGIAECPLNFFIRNGRLENRANIGANSTIHIDTSGGEVYLVGDGQSVQFGNESVLQVSGNSVRAGYFGSGSISFTGAASLRFICDEKGVSQIGEVAADSIDSTFTIASQQAELNIDLSQLRLPPGEHQLVLVKVDHLQGQFAREKITGTENTTIASATIQYDVAAGEIRVRCRSVAPAAGR